MKKRLLTLEDLYNYYSSHSQSAHFNAAEANENIVVQTEGTLRFEENDDPQEGLLAVVLQACHTDRNVNKSNISKVNMETALPSFSNRPILAYIHGVNGQPEFYSHNMHEDENGEIVYDEVPVGIVPESCNAHLEYDEEKKKDYVIVSGYIFEEYSKAAEIIRREKECPVSVELSIRELSYNAKEGYLDIENFFCSGITLLGKNSEGKTIRPGMTGSNIKLADFSQKNNSLFSDEKKLIETLDKLNTTLSNFNIEDSFSTKSTKGGTENQMDKFNELLQKYGKTVEDITFEYENLSDEDLETAFTNAFEDDFNNNDATKAAIEDNGKIYQKTFELSHDDVRTGLYALLTALEEADNDYFYINKVYDDHFIYEGWCSEKIYGQKYIKDGDNLSFDGERYNLHAEYLTDSEFAEVQSMRSNYSELVEKVNKYEAAEELSNKKSLMDSDDYSSISNKEDFVELKKSITDETNTMTYAELKDKVDDMLLSYAKSGALTFAAEDTKTVGKKQFANPSKRKTNKSRYGNLIKNIR